MWKKQQAAAVQQWPPKTEKATLDTSYNKLLTVQLIICGIILALALISKILMPPMFEAIKGEYTALVTTGTDYSKQAELIRFANAGADNIRKAAEDFALKITGASGGSYKVASRTVPSGASMEKYTLSETMQMPVTGALTSGYGFRANPVDGENDFHMGLDIAADEGAPIKSALDGVVCKTGSTRLRGNYIIIRHADGCMTLYQHLLYAYVRNGERVKKGDVIAAVGSTGYVTGPHLHFEVILNGLRVDPAYALDT